MLGLYLGSFIFGLVMIGVSVVFGGGDVDAELDMDVDHDIDASVDLVGDLADSLALDTSLEGSDIWLPFASMRFYTFFLFAFGMAGVIMWTFSVPWVVSLLVALLVGFTLGWLAAWSFRKLYAETVTGDVSLERYVGQEARVLLSVRTDKRGKVVLESPMGRVELQAETQDSQEFAPGDVVLVAHIDSGIANVTSIGLGRPDTTGA